jgi:hypothetical protein
MRTGGSCISGLGRSFSLPHAGSAQSSTQSCVSVGASSIRMACGPVCLCCTECRRHICTHCSARRYHQIWVLYTISELGTIHDIRAGYCLVCASAIAPPARERGEHTQHFQSARTASGDTRRLCACPGNLGYEHTHELHPNSHPN